MSFTQVLTANIFWVDVFAFTILGVSILFLWITSHIYLQLFSAFFFIFIGTTTLTLPFLENELLIAQNWLIEKIDNASFRLIFIFLFQNPLFTQIIIFSLLFVFTLIFVSIIYLAFIKTKFFIDFSITSFRLNFWKLIYIPFFILGIAYLTALIDPVVGTKIARKSKFINFVHQIKFNKITERKSYISLFKETKSFIQEFSQILQNKKLAPEEKRKKVITEFLKIDPKPRQKIKEVLEEAKKVKFINENEKHINKLIDSELLNDLVDSKITEENEDKVVNDILQKIEGTEFEKTLDELISDPEFIKKIDKLKGIEIEDIIKSTEIL